MSGYTRVTVAGSARRTEIALASTEPIGAVLPQLIDLLAEPTGAAGRPLVLLDALGRPLDPERSPREQGLLDGTVLQLTPFDAAPPPPLVIDVVDVVADELAIRDDRWDSAARRTVCGVLVGVASTVAALALPVPPGLDVPIGLSLLAILLAGALGSGLAGFRGLASLLSAAALGTIAAIAVPLSARFDGASAVIVPLVVTALLSAGVLLIGVGLAQKARGAGIGGVTGVMLFGMLLLALLAGAPAAQAAAVVGVLTAMLLGLAPWVALSASGLTDLDHRAADSEEVSRTQTVMSVRRAYATLTWTVVAAATAVSVCGGILWTTGDVWCRLLAVAIAATGTLRARALPLRTQGWALWAAAITVMVIAGLSALGSAPGGALAGAAALVGLAAVLAALARPRPHRRARMRAFGDLVETAAVVSLLPVTVGVFGIYPDLLGMFGGGV
jgi:hypothetical protein